MRTSTSPLSAIAIERQQASDISEQRNVSAIPPFRLLSQQANFAIEIVPSASLLRVLMPRVLLIAFELAPSRIADNRSLSRTRADGGSGMRSIVS